MSPWKVFIIQLGKGPHNEQKRIKLRCARVMATLALKTL